MPFHPPPHLYGNEMNSFETNLFARFDRSRRSGITLIEVLTSILVAVIGLFGVMVMIPFGVGQAEHGLRQEEASALALNAISDFEIRGFGDTDLWRTVTGGAPADLDPFVARPYVIDPIGVADRSAAGLDSGAFPFVSTPLPANILMNRVTIESRNVPMSRALADQLFSWGSDLVIRTPTEGDINPTYPEIDLLPPLQEFDVDSADNAVRRQAGKDMSYIVVAVPAKFNEVSAGVDQVLTWRNYFVVYEKRPQPLEFVGVTEHPYDRVFQVVPPPVVPAATVNVAYSGGDLELIDPGQTSSQDIEIKRGDWMMLTNVVESSFHGKPVQQVHFYKVVDAEQSEGENPQVTLQGPNFQFPDGADTFAVHLPDVWAVFERTFR